LAVAAPPNTLETLTLTLWAFVCPAGPAFILEKSIGKNLENLVLMAVSLIAPGVRDVDR